MRNPDMDFLVQLPEEEAVQRAFNATNHRTLGRLLLLLGVLLPVVMVILLAGGSWKLLPIPIFHLLAIRAIFLFMETEVFERHFRRFLVVFLLLQLAATIPYDLAQWMPLRIAALVAPWLFLFFRLKTEEFLVLYGTCFTVVFVLDLMLPVLGEQDFRYEPLFAITATTALLLPIAILLTRRRRRHFLEGWRLERGRSRERLRMREELEYARKIQLQMLPGTDPKIPWLELSSLSLPATEVGGDYYDYFPLGKDRLAITIGDVAGHGVGSGILLSGIRSCLYLLHEYHASPAEILVKLNRVVHETAIERMFMTLLYAVFDNRAGTLEVATAGHVPVLHFDSAKGEVREVGTPCPPLGTRLFRTPQIDSVKIAPGDGFVLYTDGLFETVSTQGEEYGYEKLKAQLLQGGTLSAKKIRDRLLNDVWTFKSDARQGDDVTMVVAKARPLSSET